MPSHGKQDAKARRRYVIETADLGFLRLHLARATTDTLRFIDARSKVRIPNKMDPITTLGKGAPSGLGRCSIGHLRRREHGAFDSRAA